MTTHLINDEWVAGEGSKFTSLNPVTEKVLWEGNAASREQVECAVHAAHSAHDSWAAKTVDQRIALLKEFGAVLEAHRAQLAAIIVAETGKIPSEANAEVTAMVNKIGISCDAYHARTGELRAGHHGISHRSHGVMAIFGPYNFPGHLANGHIVPALIAGNTIVLKPSELTPATAQYVAELWQRAGLPAGVVNLVQGGRETGEALAATNIQGLLFTGSSQTGVALHRQFGGRPEVILALEMGGNNPMIVDVNLDATRVAKIVMQSAFASAGQRCTCTRRLIIIESEDTSELLATLQEYTEALQVDVPTMSPEPTMGPVISSTARNDLLDAWNGLVQLGGVSITELRKTSHTRGYFLRPGVIDMTEAQGQGAAIPDKEYFGPLLQVYRVESFQQALALANATRYGLAAGLLSDDLVRQQAFLQGSRAGVVAINQPTAGASSTLPFGGTGLSGNHRPGAWYAADYCAWPQAQSFGHIDLVRKQL